MMGDRGRWTVDSGARPSVIPAKAGIHAMSTTLDWSSCARRFRFLVVLAFLVAAAVLPVSWAAAQSLSVFDVDATVFPLVKARFFAFDATGAPVNGLGVGDILVTEGGVPRVVQRVSCPPIDPPTPISSVLVMDVSGSMRGDGITMARAAARVWIRSMALGNSECAITSFTDRSVIVSDFRTDSTALLAAVAGLTVGGLTDYNAALLGSPTGAFDVIATGRSAKVIVFLSDGQPNDPPDQAAIIARARQLGVVIHAVMIGMVAPPEVQAMCEATGGLWFENVQTELEIVDIYRHILRTAQGGEPCEVEWLSDGCDMSHDAAFSVPSPPARDTVHYTVPIAAVPQLAWTPSSSVHFGEVTPGTVSRHDVTMTAVGRPARVDSITGTDARFRIVDTGGPLPFPLAVGQSRTISIEFAPGDSAYAFSMFTVHGEACMGRNFYADGGWRGKSQPRITVRVRRPNGGNVFVVGSDEILEWDNVPPDEKVKLEYSTDRGASWRLIADTASGLSTSWRVPRTPSSLCLLRATAHMPVPYLEDFAEIPAGSFRMGDQTGAGFAEELPVHTVELTRPLMVMRTEVTQAQWMAVMGTNPSHFRSDSLPVESVRWIEAVEFCNRLSVQQKLDTCYRIIGDSVICDFNATGFRLPTEAEWEYLCRAGTATDFWTGNMTEPSCDPLDQVLDRAGWYCGNAAGGSQKVGGRLPNAFGLFDLHGNVFEWCWDRFDPGWYPASPATDPTGPDTGGPRVVRGGSWAGSADFCRSARRSGNYPTDRFSDVGFRVVRLKK